MTQPPQPPSYFFPNNNGSIQNDTGQSNQTSFSEADMFNTATIIISVSSGPFILVFILLWFVSMVSCGIQWTRMKRAHSILFVFLFMLGGIAFVQNVLKVVVHAVLLTGNEVMNWVGWIVCAERVLVSGLILAQAIVLTVIGGVL